MRFLNTVRATTVALGLVLVSHSAAAQDERLSVHGSLNLGIGKTDGLPYLGFTKDGTSNYRAIALQFGYKIDNNDRVVTQLLHRKLGESPLNAIEPAISPVWAFYEHRFDNGVATKLGRSPLPRGLFNEVRFIGTLLPFFRVGPAVYQETLENIDGVVVSKPFEIGKGFGIETYAFAGGFDLKAQVPGASGNSVVNTRYENTYGAQLWLTTPIEGVKLGGYLHSVAGTPRLSKPEAQRSPRILTAMYSADASFTHGFLRGELTTFSGKNAISSTDYSAWYVQGGVKPIEQLTIAVEYDAANNNTRLPSPLPMIDIPVNRDLAVGLTFKPSATVAFKLEGHRNEGYQFDAPVPMLVLPTRPPLVATLAPASKAYYAIASIAVSF